MSKKPRSVEEIVEDPAYQKARSLFDEEAERLQVERARETHPLLERLRKFGLNYNHIGELWTEPKDTFALVLPIMSEYLTNFRDAGNIAALSMALARTEARGIASKPLIDLYKGLDQRGLYYLSEDTFYQVAKAISVTADASDLDAVKELFLADTTHEVQKIEFLRAIVRLAKNDLNGFLISCLDMPDLVVVEILKILKRRRGRLSSSDLARLDKRGNSRISKILKGF